MSRFRCCGCLKCCKGEVDEYDVDLIEGEQLKDNNQKQQSRITVRNNNQFLENIVNKKQVQQSKQQLVITGQNNNPVLENIVNNNQNNIVNNNPKDILNKKQGQQSKQQSGITWRNNNPFNNSFNNQDNVEKNIYEYTMDDSKKIFEKKQNGDKAELDKKEQQLKITEQNEIKKQKNDFKADNCEIISLNDEIKDDCLKKFVEEKIDDKTSFKYNENYINKKDNNNNLNNNQSNGGKNIYEYTMDDLEESVLFRSKKVIEKSIDNEENDNSISEYNVQLDSEYNQRLRELQKKTDKEMERFKEMQKKVEKDNQNLLKQNKKAEQILDFFQKDGRIFFKLLNKKTAEVNNQEIKNEYNELMDYYNK